MSRLSLEQWRDIAQHTLVVQSDKGHKYKEGTAEKAALVAFEAQEDLYKHQNLSGIKDKKIRELVVNYFEWTFLGNAV